MSYAAMVNKAGNIVQPTAANVQSAMNDFIETVHQGLHYCLSRFLYCVRRLFVWAMPNPDPS